MNENQIMEMFRILTNLTKDVTNLTKDVAEIKITMARMETQASILEQGQNELNEKFDRLHENFTEFRDETRKNFAEISNERKQDRRVVHMISNDLLDTKALVTEAFERIEKLEQKAA